MNRESLLEAELRAINAEIPEDAKLATEGHMPSAVRWMAQRLSGEVAEPRCDGGVGVEVCLCGEDTKRCALRDVVAQCPGDSATCLCDTHVWTRHGAALAKLSGRERKAARGKLLGSDFAVASNSVTQ